MDDNDIPDKSAIYYMTQQDIEDMVAALSLAMTNPKAAFLKNSRRFPGLLKQFKNRFK